MEQYGQCQTALTCAVLGINRDECLDEAVTRKPGRKARTVRNEARGVAGRYGRDFELYSV